MRSNISNIVLIIGVLCLVGGAALVLFGQKLAYEPHSLAALGIIFVAVGAAGKQKKEIEPK